MDPSERRAILRELLAEEAAFNRAELDRRIAQRESDPAYLMDDATAVAGTAVDDDVVKKSNGADLIYKVYEPPAIFSPEQEAAIVEVIVRLRREFRAALERRDKPKKRGRKHAN
jgi:hypothetical protein